MHVLYYIITRLVWSTLWYTQDYSTESFTPTQQVLLQDLRELGLVYQRKVIHTSAV